MYWFIDRQMWEEIVCRLGHMLGESGSTKVISIRLCVIAFLTKTPYVDDARKWVPWFNARSFLI